MAAVLAVTDTGPADVFIQSVGVDLRWQRRGVAASALDEMLDRLAADAVAVGALYLDASAKVHRENALSRRLLRGHGFVSIPYDDPYDLWALRVPLKG